MVMQKHIVRMPPRTLKKNVDQGELLLRVDRHVEDEGIGMGVLSDGTPFLNQRGLALLCGVRNKYIGEITSEWCLPVPGERTAAIKYAMENRGEACGFAAHDTMYGKVRILAYPESVCMAILEHFAFDADWAGRDTALGNYRKLARYGLKKFIYDRVGYDSKPETDVWQIFRDRVSLTYDAVPIGYFGVFKELSGLIVTLGLNGLHIDEKFVPDISVGQAWAKYWTDEGLTEKYGARASYLHYYPTYFRQAASNPQCASCYPEDALGEFRRWFRQDYIGEGRFKSYLARKVSEKLLPTGYVERAILALTRE
jgi:hypothetical protein